LPLLNSTLASLLINRDFGALEGESNVPRPKPDVAAIQACLEFQGFALGHGQIEPAPNHNAVFRPRLKLTAHQGSNFVDAAMRPASNFAHKRRTAVAVALHAPVVEIDQFVRNACTIAVTDKCRPGFRKGAACPAADAVKGHQDRRSDFFYAMTGCD